MFMLFVLLASGQLRPRLTSLHAVESYLDLGIDAFGRYEGPGQSGEGLLIFPKISWLCASFQRLAVPPLSGLQWCFWDTPLPQFADVKAAHGAA